MTLRERLRRVLPVNRGEPAAPPAPFYLVSAGGQPNFGDELITRAWLEYLARRRPDVEVWLDCPEPGRAAHLFARFHPRLKTTNTLWQLAQLPAAPGAAGAHVIDLAVARLGSPKFDAGLLALRSMQSIHVLGGGYITSMWPRHLGVLIGAVAVSREFGVPLFVTGQGWLPMEADDVEWVRAHRRHIAIAEARDRRTAETFDLEAGLDDAYLTFSGVDGLKHDETAPDVMLLVQGDLAEHVGKEEAFHILSHFMDRHARDARVGVVEAIPPEDSWLLEGVRQLRPDVEFYSFGRIWDEGFPARPGQKWLTSRFHAHLVAAAHGATGVALSLVPGYYDFKHELLLENGTGWTFARSVDELEAQEPGSDSEFPARAVEYARRKRELADRLYPGR